MKLTLKILAGIAALLLLLMVAINIYFTDERLREMILPQVSEALDRDVQVERMSVTLFRTFPRFGLRMDGFNLPDDYSGSVASFDNLTAAVRIFPLLRNEISISRLDISNPVIYYMMYADSTTNIDFLLSDEAEDLREPQDPETAYSISIPHFNIQGGRIFFEDETTEMRVDIEGLDAEIGLTFADLIESSADVRLGSLSAWAEGTPYVTGLQLQLQQESTINLEEEILELNEGTFSIRGLALNLNGSFAAWGTDSPVIDLQFNSATDNFGELLRLAPPDFDEHLRGMESRGSLVLEGSVSGTLAEGQIPGFSLLAEVADGYLQNPDLEEPVEDINFSLQADNEVVTLTRFSAVAAGNRVEASGSLERPFDEDAEYTFDLSGDVDLATISQFYPLEQDGVEALSGVLSARAEGAGNLLNPEETLFSGSFQLGNGLFKYVDVPRAIENIEANIDASQDRITIHAASFSAAGNQFSASGSVSDPLAEMPNFDIAANLDFDLASLSQFYPIDEDTLSMRGRLTASASLRGQADEIERTLQDSDIEFRDGYIAYHQLQRPLEDITFLATASSSRLNISEARFRTGENSLIMSGRIDNFLDEEPLFDIEIAGFATLADISSYYSLEPWISELTGNAQMNLGARGPAGRPADIALNGSLELNDVFASGDSLALPVTELAGELSVTPETMALNSFFMKYGASDFSLEGRLENYLGFLEEHDSETSMPAVSGTYYSRLLNMDEMIDWDEETEEPILIELPEMTSSVTAAIDTLLVFGIPVTSIQGHGRTNPEQLLIEDATAEMFDGTANGSLVWNIPRPDQTNLRFNGDLNDLQVDAFFREFPILGENSRFEQYVTGGFSAGVDYFTVLDEFIDPDITLTTAEGSFGMSRARLRGHPMQETVAGWLGADELRSLALDEWTATFSISESVLTLNDFRLTSENIGIELDGTQHLVSDEIDFEARLFLPPRFRRGLSSVLSTRIVDGLTRDDDIIVIPLRITGTMENPRLTPRENMIEDLLRDTGRDLIRGLFNRNE